MSEPITRAWLDEDGLIRCLSQFCEWQDDVCLRINKCKVVEVEIKNKGNAEDEVIVSKMEIVEKMEVQE